jgi:hypothetical protein
MALVQYLRVAPGPFDFCLASGVSHDPFRGTPEPHCAGRATRLPLDPLLRRKSHPAERSHLRQIRGRSRPGRAGFTSTLYRYEYRAAPGGPASGKARRPSAVNEPIRHPGMSPARRMDRHQGQLETPDHAHGPKLHCRRHTQLTASAATQTHAWQDGARLSVLSDRPPRYYDLARIVRTLRTSGENAGVIGAAPPSGIRLGPCGCILGASSPSARR